MRVQAPRLRPPKPLIGPGTDWLGWGIPLSRREQQPSWEDILWREWCHGDDDELAARTYEALADREPSPRARHDLVSRDLGGVLTIGVGTAAAWLVASMLLLLAVGPGTLSFRGESLVVGLGLLVAPVAAASARVLARRSASRSPTWRSLFSRCGVQGAALRTPRYRALPACLLDAMPAARHRRPTPAELRWALSHPECPESLRGYAPREPQAQAPSRERKPSRWELEPATAEDLEAVARMPPEKLIRKLRSKDRAIAEQAYRALIAAGASAVPDLLEADKYGLIEDGTLRRILDATGVGDPFVSGPQPREWLCQTCYCRFRVWTGRTRGGQTVYYAGCRACKRLGASVRHPGPVTAVLDTHDDREHWREGGSLCVNWLTLARRTSFDGQCLFDFDEVAIRAASDDEVRHFLVDVTSDTDKERRKRYRSMHLTVEPAVDLSPNTLAALRKEFPNASP